MTYITVNTYVDVKIDLDEIIDDMSMSDRSELVLKLAPGLDRDLLELYYAIAEKNKSEVDYRMKKIFTQLRFRPTAMSAA